MKLTHTTAHALFNIGSPNSAQLHLLGLPPYPLKKGWMKELIGREMPDDLYQQVLALKGRKPKGAMVKEWRAAKIVIDPSAKNLL